MTFILNKEEQKKGPHKVYCKYQQLTESKMVARLCRLKSPWILKQMLPRKQAYPDLIIVCSQNDCFSECYEARS